MIDVTEINVGSEVCTAVLRTHHHETSYVGHITIGYYKDTVEIWIEREGQRVQIEEGDLADVIKQLKRAERLARDARGDA